LVFIKCSSGALSFSFAGVVETGLFVNMATKVFYGTADGAVKEHKVIRD
jgi:ribose 5-phosphate isomerase